jgi:hypothetical protein
VVILGALLIIVVLYTVKNKEGETPTERAMNALDDAKALDLDAQIRTIFRAMNVYYSDMGEYPEILDLLVPKYIRLERDLNDPWGTRFKIENDDEMNLILVSAGRDKTFGNEDDIRRRL